MARYALANNATIISTQQALTTTYKTLIELTSLTGATTLRKAWIYDIMFGTDGTPADNVLNFVVNRQTTTGTGTTLAPTVLDFGDAAALITAKVNNTIEPTITDSTGLVQIGMNQRASYRWVAAPGGELVVPATTGNGIGVRAKSPAYTGTSTACINFWE